MIVIVAMLISGRSHLPSCKALGTKREGSRNTSDDDNALERECARADTPATRTTAERASAGFMLGER